jgi:hypothetical protein
MDAKVQALSEPMQRRLVMLWCCRAMFGEGIDDGQVGYVLRLTPEDVADTKRTLRAVGLIGKSWDIPTWEGRQPYSDHSTERVRKFRERRRAAENDGVKRDETVTETVSCNGMKPLLKRRETVTETDKKERKKEETPSGSLIGEDHQLEIPTGGGDPLTPAGTPAADIAALYAAVSNVIGPDPAYNLLPAVRDLYPAGWIVSAAREAFVKRRDKGRPTDPAFVVSILKRYAREGGPDASGPATPAPASAASPRVFRPEDIEFSPDIEALIRGDTA